MDCPRCRTEQYCSLHGHEGVIAAREQAIQELTRRLNYALNTIDRMTRRAQEVQKHIEELTMEMKNGTPGHLSR